MFVQPLRRIFATSEAQASDAGECRNTLQNTTSAARGSGGLDKKHALHCVRWQEGSARLQQSTPIAALRQTA